MIATNFIFPRIKLIYVFFFSLLLFAKPINAQQETKTSSLLWEITGNDLTSPSYLYGTIHIISKEDFFIRKEVDSVFKLCNQVAFEIKLDDMAALMGIEKKMELPEGQTISGMMNPTDYQKLKTYFIDSFDINLEEYDTKKPLALQQLLITNMIDGETESYELYFLMQCMQYKKKIKGLETVDEQLAIFDSIPYTEQLQWMVDGFNDTTNLDNLWNAIIEAYKSENLETISNLLSESSPELMEYDDIMLINRNKKWIPEIENIMKSEATFIAVGAGHLPFDTGVIQLLKDKGYTLKPL